MLYTICRSSGLVLLLPFRVTENSSRETMDPASGLPDPAYEGCEKNARRPAFRVLRRNLAHGTSGREFLGWEILETKKVNLTPWGGALSRMGVVVHSLPVPLGAGRGEVSVGWESPGGSWVPARFYLQNFSQTSPLSLVFLTPLCSLGTQVFTK